MQALFLLWCGEYLVRVEYLRAVGNTDLPATAFRAMKRTMLDEDTLTADRCTIYLIKDRKLILAGRKAMVLEFDNEGRLIAVYNEGREGEEDEDGVFVAEGS